MPVLAYFITFTTYGTWLHGSEKGSIDRAHNVFGEEPVLPNNVLIQYRQKLMKQPSIMLNPECRRIVLNAIHNHSEYRNWHLWAAHVRTNHVHIVTGFGDGTKSAERMMTEFKAYASRNLNTAKAYPNEFKHWTRHGSTRHLHTEDDLNRAIYYVVHEQGDVMNVYEAPR